MSIVGFLIVGLIAGGSSYPFVYHWALPTSRGTDPSNRQNVRVKSMTSKLGGLCGRARCCAQVTLIICESAFCV